ncbi:MAG: sulfite exporter TauE/SafE family protein [Candidatus Dormibacteraeota bacterium]|nr:sulfite exporter TauE/SafE family protein [Candidatus Dormibacteraeota bacterium]
MVAASALVAAAINAVAGGGSLVSFPTLLLAGYPPLLANITNTVGLVLGYAGGSTAYRGELRGQWRRVRDLGIIGALGAVLGAFLLTRTRASVFEAIVPWLLLAGSALTALQPLAGRVVRRGGGRAGRRAHPVLGLLVFANGVWGAFFGVGLSLLLVGALGLFIDDGLQRLNALKGALSLVINLVAAAYFVAFAAVAWEAALVMLPAALVGGFLGVALARRLPAAALRAVVVLVGIAVSIRLLV